MACCPALIYHRASFSALLAYTVVPSAEQKARVESVSCVLGQSQAMFYCVNTTGMTKDTEQSKEDVEATEMHELGLSVCECTNTTVCQVVLFLHAVNVNCLEAALEL